MRILVLLLLIAGLLAACGNAKSPAGIIPGPKMETIIWQMMQADEYVNKLLLTDSTKKSSTERSRIYQEVFDLNKTSLEEFKKSYQYYITHPEISKVMFDSISAKASRQRISLYLPKADSASGPENMRLIQMQKHKADSIARANGQLKINKAVIDTARLRKNLLKLRKPVKDTAAKHPLHHK